jgi:ribonuclease G
VVGNIYKAIVTRVLPGMQCAFVNIGSDRSAFLYGGDVVDPDSPTRIPSEDGETLENKKPIESLLKPGQEIIVQVAKEPLGTKGPRVTTMLTIPGQVLVLMPDIDHVAISRRIENEEVRAKLLETVGAIKPPDTGLIIRTAAEHSEPEQLKRDLDYLLNIWESIKKRRKKASAPALLYQEPNIILKTTRDLYSEDVDEFVVDDQQAYEQLKHFLKDMIPDSDSKLVLFKNDNPIFDEYGVEMDVAMALARKVWLPSGGYLVIEQTEALASFDVNTGKFVGTSNVQETILKTNLEAAEEIVNQLKIRNIGGIIVIDFIDMDREEDREKVNRCLETALKKDKARIHVLSINEFGLVQMTRKRTSDSLERTMTESCPTCEGLGRTNKVDTEAYNLTRELDRYLYATGKKTINVRIRDDILEWMTKEEPQLLQYLKDKYDAKIIFHKSPLNRELLKESNYEILN